MAVRYTDTNGVQVVACVRRRVDTGEGIKYSLVPRQLNDDDWLRENSPKAEVVNILYNGVVKDKEVGSIAPIFRVLYPTGS